MDLQDFDRLDGRRLEVVADGLPLFGGAQLIDATLVSALKRDGTARARTATMDGAALIDARRRGPNLPRSCWRKRKMSSGCLGW